MLYSSKPVTKFIIAAFIIVSLIVSTVSPAFAVHNRLRQGTNVTAYNRVTIARGK